MNIKSVVAVLLSACVISGNFSLEVQAGQGDIVEKTVQFLGIMNGDENGGMNLSELVTRAQFTKMLVSASSKDKVISVSNTSLFNDVKYSHWAAGNIKLAIEQGLIAGYVDGSFKPDRNVTLEEGVTMVLRLLGYDSSKLKGTYPAAQLDKYINLELNENIDTSLGQYLTREDSMNLFYNMMGAETAEGTIYGEGLGYTMDENAVIDYDQLIADETEGPFVVENSGWVSTLPFSISDETVYLDGNKSSLYEVMKHDVIYYNEVSKTIWAYSNKVLGICTVVSPNKANPTEVMVAGNTYTLETKKAIEKFSVTGDYGVGDSVALLMGDNNTVVDVISVEEVNEVRYGVVIELDALTYKLDSGKSRITQTAIVACTDGVERQYAYAGSTLRVGQVVSASYVNGKTSIVEARRQSVSGLYDKAYGKLGSYTLASDIEILDVDGDVKHKVIYPSRVDGEFLNTEDILTVAFNEKNEIESLILNNVTGDHLTYGALTDIDINLVEVKKNDGSVVNEVVSKTFNYMIDGIEGSQTVAAEKEDDEDEDAGTKKFNYYATTGGVQFNYDEEGILEYIFNMNQVSVSAITSLSVQSNSTKYGIAEDVQVYYVVNGEYYMTQLSAVTDLGQYSLVAYIDSGHKLGGLVRVIEARDKTN